MELLAIPLLSVLAHGSVKVVIYIGIGGVFGVLIGGLLVACGLLIWFHPVQRVFYAIAGVLLAVASFVATNLGGFFLGMLLGVTGASLSFGWTPGLAGWPASTARAARQGGQRASAPGPGWQRPGGRGRRCRCPGGASRPAGPGRRTAPLAGPIEWSGRAAGASGGADHEATLVGAVSRRLALAVMPLALARA